MPQSTSRTWKKIACFYAMTFAISFPFWWIMINSSISLLPLMGLMWSPALAAILIKLAFRERIRELGFSPRNGRLQLLGYALPFLYATPIYLVVWLVGQEGFRQTVLGTTAAVRFPDLPASQSLAWFVLLSLTLGFLDKATRALGEEIGWRGFLVPELARATSFTGVGLISGLMWALWHYPLIVLGSYHSKAPMWYGLLCFTVMVVAWGVIAAWLRLRSGSIWPVTILHASHNALIQLVLNPLTVSTGATVYLIDEFGAGVALGTVCIAVFVWVRAERSPRVQSDA